MAYGTHHTPHGARSMARTVDGVASPLAATTVLVAADLLVGVVVVDDDNDVSSPTQQSNPMQLRINANGIRPHGPR